MTFNAWKYATMEVVWPALVREIVTELDTLSTWPLHKRLWTRLSWNLKRQWRQLWGGLITGAIVVGAAIAAAIAKGETNVARAIGAVVGVLGVGGLAKAATDPVGKWVTALFADSDYGHQLRVMQDIKHDLDTLEERLHADGNPKAQATGHILVLIDDLDRCEPGKAVEVLQAVNLLLNYPSFIVCLGIDARIVTAAVEKHYEGLLEKAGASGYEYLDKIVQIPFRIPEPARNEVVAFVAGQLGNPDKPQEPQEHDPTERTETDSGVADNDDAPMTAATRGLEADDARPDPERLSDYEPLDLKSLIDHPPQRDSGVAFTYAEQQAFERFADYLRPNPRHLKRLVNVYRLVRSLARGQNEALILERPAATIRWLVMWSQWPYASLAMIGRFEELLEMWGEAIADNMPPGAPMLQLLDHVDAALHGPTRARIDDDAGRLRELLLLEGCGLTWDEIRRIRRYTVNFNPAVEEQIRDGRTKTAPTTPTPHGAPNSNATN